jgi:hypothetical protein
MKTLEDRIAFLELELLKQALLNPTPLAADTDVSGSRNSSVAGSVPGSSRSRQGFSSTAAALNPAGAGAGGLNAAAAAAAGRWNADSVLDRQPQGAVGNLLSSSSSGGGDAPGPVIDAVSITTHLAAAAELGQLDPDVYALADALAVRRGFAGLSPAEPQPRAYGRLSTQQKQQRRPAGVWGRSAHYARPLSANAWGNSLYDPAGYGEPLITKQDLEEEVPSKPSGWAVVGTIVVVYLGVIVTFLAVCMGDVVSDIPL